jgi:putative MATE family efflux protein
MGKNEKLLNGSIPKLLLEFSIPAIIGSLVFALYNIVDRIFIGNLGTYAIAGVSITFPIFTIIIAFGMFVGQGGAPLISIRLGQNNNEGASRVLSNVFLMFTIISIIMMCLFTIFLNKLLILFGASGNTLPYARDYMRIINFSIFFNFIALGMCNQIRAEGNSKLAMKAMLIGAILNIILDPIFIFYFKLGVSGAAYATAISNMVSAAFVMFYFTKSKKSILKIKLEYLKLEKEIIKEISKIGLSPLSLQLAASFVAVFANKALLKYGGDVAVGAMGIVNSVYLFMVIVINGINQGAQPIIGFNYGAERYGRVKDTLKIAIFSAMALAILGFIIIEFFPQILISLFNKSDAVLIDTTVSGIRIYLSMIILAVVQIIGASYFQSVGYPQKSIMLNLSRQVFLFIPLLLILPRIFGINGVWLTGAIADVVSFLITAVFMLKEMKRLEECHELQMCSI